MWGRPHDARAAIIGESGDGNSTASHSDCHHLRQTRRREGREHSMRGHAAVLWPRVSNSENKASAPGGEPGCQPNVPFSRFSRPSRLSQVMAAPVRPTRCANGGAVLEQRKTRRREGRENSMLVKVAVRHMGWRSTVAEAHVCWVCAVLPAACHHERSLQRPASPFYFTHRCVTHSARSPLQPH